MTVEFEENKPVGESKNNAILAVESLFKAIAKNKQMEHVSSLNEVLCFIEKHKGEK